MGMNIKVFNSSLVTMVMLFLLASNCKKQDDIPVAKDPFQVIELIPLTDKIPFQALGSGKILFDRMYDPDRSGFYIIDIDKKTTSGFRLNSLTVEPNISPDGTRLACSLLNDDWKNSWNIYIMNLDGSDCFPSYKSYEWESYPTWTPDGSKIIYYNQGNEGPLYMQSPIENATDRVELTKFYYGDDPEWIIIPSGGFSISPAGKLICVSSSMKLMGILSIDPYKGKAGVSTILTRSGNQSIESPVFSPDGSIIAFVSIETDPVNGSGAVSVKTINPDGSNLTQLASVSTYGSVVPYTRLHRIVSLCWSPDGTKILFTAPTEEKGCHLFVINSDGTGLTQVTDNIQAYDDEVSWSR
jgi:Tol biopolymer transport system component